MGLNQAMRLRWVAVGKAAARAPAQEPAADGGGKADKKKDKGDSDRVTRQVLAGIAPPRARARPASPPFLRLQPL